MDELTNNEITFITDILEEKRGYRGGSDIITDNTALNKTEIYFLIQKLEKLK